MKHLILAFMLAVHDGDTVTVAIPAIGLQETVRLVSIDAPEIPPRARCLAEAEGANAARAAMAALLPPGTRVWLTPNIGRPRDRYGRLLADVQIADGRDAGNVLLRRGLVRPYHGEKRKGWCHDAASVRRD